MGGGKFLVLLLVTLWLGFGRQGILVSGSFIACSSTSSSSTGNRWWSSQPQVQLSSRSDASSGQGSQSVQLFGREEKQKQSRRYEDSGNAERYNRPRHR